MARFSIHPWQLDAACANLPNVDSLFFPSQTRRAWKGWEAGKTVCASCLVRRECLEQALADEGPTLGQTLFGLFGGATPEERFEIAANRTGKPREELSTYRYLPRRPEPSRQENAVEDVDV